MINRRHATRMSLIAFFWDGGPVREGSDLVDRGDRGQKAYILPQKKDAFVSNNRYAQHIGGKSLALEGVPVDTETQKTMPGWIAWLFCIGIICIVGSFILSIFVENGIILLSMSAGFFAMAGSLEAAKHIGK
jgi:hypothetical protein